jgi:hypothetical protein
VWAWLTLRIHIHGCVWLRVLTSQVWRISKEGGHFLFFLERGGEKSRWVDRRATSWSKVIGNLR